MAVTQTTKEIECFYYDQFNFISRFALSLLVKKHFLPLNAVTRFQLFAEDEHKRYEIKAQIPLSQDHTEKKKLSPSSDPIRFRPFLLSIASTELGNRLNVGKSKMNWRKLHLKTSICSVKMS